MSNNSKIEKIYLHVEFLILFIISPIILYFIRDKLRFLIIPILLIVACFCGFIILKDRQFNRLCLWNSNNLFKHFKWILIKFIPSAILFIVTIFILKKELLFNFFLQRPDIWLIVIIFYPFVSVYPQELIFRSFFFHRYETIFKKRKILIIASGVCFSLAHLFFGNWIAPTLTLFGGLLFANTYSKTSSLLATCIEHGLWGDFIFTLGLGMYLYGGAIQ